MPSVGSSSISRRGRVTDIERVIRALAQRGTMAILPVEQYFEFARDLAASYLVMQRGEVVLSGRREDMDEAAVRSYLTVGLATPRR
jgi:urea transport system ATP-binding protein